MALISLTFSFSEPCVWAAARGCSGLSVPAAVNAHPWACNLSPCKKIWYGDEVECPRASEGVVTPLAGSAGLVHTYTMLENPPGLGL